jgi:hypothetical protein
MVLNGIEAPSDEPSVWIGKILRRLQPEPRSEVSELFDLGDGYLAFVVKVEPVASPPCMTPEGRIYERVSGETLPVDDPALLDRLFRRGDHARGRGEQGARRAARRASLLPGWWGDHSVSLTVGLASVGRATDDIASRLFTGDTHDAVVKSIWELIGERNPQPEPPDVSQRQDTYTALAESRRNQHFGPGSRVVGIIRTSQYLQANWDGSVAAGMWFSDDPLTGITQPDQLIETCWREAASINRLLGGYGPAYLHVLFSVAEAGQPQLFGEKEIRVAGRVPPQGTLYASLPRRTEMGRLLERGEPDRATVDSLWRELQRAAGIRTDEPV